MEEKLDVGAPGELVGEVDPASRQLKCRDAAGVEDGVQARRGEVADDGAQVGASAARACPCAEANVADPGRDSLAIAPGRVADKVKKGSTIFDLVVPWKKVAARVETSTSILSDDVVSSLSKGHCSISQLPSSIWRAKHHDGPPLRIAASWAVQGAIGHVTVALRDFDVGLDDLEARRRQMEQARQHVARQAPQPLGTAQQLCNRQHSVATRPPEYA
mmetsp:Transcript_17996/g.57557  ORF Transcript_17996/g.57557 Transcript_17996/m.57557 type:complete len:217 (+) Transcript_17996:745-1395(+)